MGNRLVLVRSGQTPGGRLPGAGPRGSPWSPVQSVRREGIPCAAPDKLLRRVIHPACGRETVSTKAFRRCAAAAEYSLTELSASVKPSTAAEKRASVQRRSRSGTAPLRF